MNLITFYHCPKCGELATVNTSVVLTSYPPQYSYYCDNCKETGYVFCSDVNLCTSFKGATYHPED